MLLSPDQYGERRGVSGRAVRKAIATGRLSLSVVGEGRRRKIDPDIADKEWNSNTQGAKQRGAAAAAAEARSGGEPGAGPLTQAKASALKSALQAKILELELRKRQNALLDSEAVSRQVERSFRDIRDRLLAVPLRVAPLVAAEPDQRRCEDIIGKAIKETLERFADGLPY